MHLSVAIPEAQVVEAPALLRLVRMAPAHEMEADDQGPTYVALFEDFPASVETVIRLIEETWDLCDVHILLDGRPITSRIGFYAALRCYQESRSVPDVNQYCLQRARQVAMTRGCPNQSCEPRCQFICATCAKLSRDPRSCGTSIQLEELARRTDVDWCPHLGLTATHA